MSLTPSLPSLPHHPLPFHLSAYEIHRQTALLSSSLLDAHVPQETRGFDERRFETYKLRTKEDAPDYRYMPDPNLGVVIVNEVCKAYPHSLDSFLLLIPLRNCNGVYSRDHPLLAWVTLDRNISERYAERCLSSRGLRVRG